MEGGDGGDEKSRLFMTSFASADCFASRRPASVARRQVSRKFLDDGGRNFGAEKKIMTRRTKAGWRGNKRPGKRMKPRMQLKEEDKETRLRLAEAMDRLHTFSAKRHCGRHLERYRCRIKVGEQM